MELDFQVLPRPGRALTNRESNCLIVPPSSVAIRFESEELSFFRAVDLDYLALLYNGPFIFKTAENLANLLLIFRMVSGSSSNRFASRVGEGEGEGEGEWLCSLTEIFYLYFDFEEAEYLSFSRSFLRLLRKVGIRGSLSMLGKSGSFSAFWSLGGVTLILGAAMFCECLRVCRKRGERPLLLSFGLKTNSATRETSLFRPRRTSAHRHSPPSNGIAMFGALPEEDLKYSALPSASRKAASLAKLQKFSPLEARFGCGEKALTCLSFTETMFFTARGTSGFSLGVSAGSGSAQGLWLKVLFLRKAFGFDYSLSSP